MSKEVTSQKMKQTCDGCGKVHDWELVGADQNSFVLAEMQEWFIVGRKAIIDGQMRQLSADACSVDCVSVVALKLLIPPSMQETPADNIDLASLRTSGLN